MRGLRMHTIALGAAAVLAGCGSSDVPPLSDAEAIKALTETISTDAKTTVADPSGKRNHTPVVNVSNLFLRDCERGPQTVCTADFDAGDHWSTRVAFWKTPNPRHPWRATIVGERP